MANIVYMAKSAWTGLLDSIRSKAGTQASMTVSQATDAVDSIQTGGGGGDEFIQLIERTISGTVYDASASQVGSYAFNNCSLMTECILPSATNIEAWAFAYCIDLELVSFPAVLTIGSSAFLSCRNMTDAYFPNVTSIKENAFGRCALRYVDMPELTLLGVSVFQSCSYLTSVSLPALSSLPIRTFESCRSLSALYLPACSVILQSAASGCYSLAMLSLPAVTSIGSFAFNAAYHLLSVYLMGSVVPTLANSSAFGATPVAGRTTSTGGVYGSIFVPASLYDQYISATNWSYFSSRFVSV